jgi:hypothetical protein
MPVLCSLGDLAADFADALQSVDADRIGHKQFAPGIGPYREAEAVRAALTKLRTSKPAVYAAAVIKRVPDLLIPVNGRSSSK